MSKLEKDLAWQMAAAKIPPWVTEYRFAAIAAGWDPVSGREQNGGKRLLRDLLEVAGTKDWRFDFAWPNCMLAVEVEGGQWVDGRHNRPAGFSDDCEKYNEAALAGWIVIRVTGDMVRDGRALKYVERAISSGGDVEMAIAIE